MTTPPRERLTGKVALVTGGASGIRLATARRFAAEGARVMIGDLDGDGLAAAERELGDAVAGWRCDVRVERDVEALTTAAVERFGRLDVLVRTGLTEGIWHVPGIVEEFDANAPLATTTSADDVANLVTFLASDDASSISGCLYLVDRGAHTQRYPNVLARVAPARDA